MAHEGITREEGLRTITSVPVRQLSLNDKIGSLESVKYADFTVLEFDWMVEDLADLETLDAKAVFIAGELA